MLVVSGACVAGGRSDLTKRFVLMQLTMLRERNVGNEGLGCVHIWIDDATLSMRRCGACLTHGFSVNVMVNSCSE